jgi:hypothetical protein
MRKNYILANIYSINKRLLIAMLLILTIENFTNAQSWQWGKRAGSEWFSVNAQEERPVDVATDNNGNVYVLSLLYPTAQLSLGSQYVGNIFVSNAPNVLLHSYNCEGTLRWSKLIGTSSGATAKSIQLDTLGGVYLLTKIFTNGTPVHLHTDTGFAAGNKQMYIVKYDTAGAFKWLRAPESDSISFINSYSNGNIVDMHVSKAGDVSVIAELPPGGNLNNTLVLTTPRLYSLKYNRLGAFQLAVPLDFNVTGVKATYSQSCNVTVAPNGNYIFTGYRFYVPQDTLIIGTDTIQEKTFIACLSPTGSMLWHHQGRITNTSLMAFTNTLFLGRAVVDNENNIYAAGECAPNDTIAGNVFYNTIFPNGSAMAMIMKFRPSGSVIWGQNSSNRAVAFASGVAVSQNKVATTGFYSAELKWNNSNLSPNAPANQGWAVFITLFDAESGEVLNLDTLAGATGSRNYGYCMAANKKADFFVAGNYESYIVIADSILGCSGSDDVYIAKYGNNNCDFSIGIQSVDAEIKGITVFPNPSSGNFSVVLPNNNTEITVTNMLGQEVLKTIATEKTINLRLDNDGIYIITAKSNLGTLTQKIIVSR